MIVNNGAIDEGVMNLWDNGTIGNFWSAYIGIDENDDGIGDTPMPIDGGGEATDLFPMMHLPLFWDFTPPILSSPPDITVVVGTPGAIILWEVFDHFPGHYTITDNGAVVTFHAPWSGSTISFSLTGLGVGTHIITISVVDLRNNTATDTVVVVITPSSVPTTVELTTTTSAAPISSFLFFNLISAFVFILVLRNRILIKRDKEPRS